MAIEQRDYERGDIMNDNTLDDSRASANQLLAYVHEVFSTNIP